MPIQYDSHGRNQLQQTLHVSQFQQVCVSCDLLSLILLGGWNGTYLADILQFDPASKQWKMIGQMINERTDHSLSLLPLVDAQKLCVT